MENVKYNKLTKVKWVGNLMKTMEDEIARKRDSAIGCSNRNDDDNVWKVDGPNTGAEIVDSQSYCREAGNNVPRDTRLK